LVNKNDNACIRPTGTKLSNMKSIISNEPTL